MGFVNRCSTGKRIEMGRIDLMSNFSFFEVPEAQTRAVINALQGADFDGRKVNVEVSQPEGEAKTVEYSSPKPRSPRAERRSHHKSDNKPMDWVERRTGGKASKKEKGWDEPAGAKRGRGSRPEWAVFFDNPEFQEKKGKKKKKK